MQQGAGYYTVSMKRGTVATGAYLVVFKAGKYYQKKMIFLMK
jgi:5-hydroxyisourate hydrolase-like protein (transthyretin family)